MLESSLKILFPSQFCLLGVVGILLLVIAEIGFRMGSRISRQDNDASKSEISGYQGAVLGLLALLLGFTFSMALNHYDLRRSLMVQEANSIGTTYLRTAFLPEGVRETSRRLLQSYVQLRMEQGYLTGIPNNLQMKTSAILDELWKQAEVAAVAAPNPITSTYIISLNETIDLAATRLAAARYRVPSALWVMLVLVSAFGIWASGFSAGVNRKRAWFLAVGLPVLITLVMLLIADISLPHHGFIRADYSSMVDLLESMKKP